MILIILLFIGQVDSTRSLINSLNHQEAYNLIREAPVRGLSQLDKCEVLELKALTAVNLRKFEEAENIYSEVFRCDNEKILRKAYTNYADLQYRQFNFDKRLEYLQKAYHIESTPQLTRIIARHHFQIRADYDTAQIWIDRHTSQTLKDRAGFALLQAEFTESKRQYTQAIDHYSRAQVHAKEAGLFSYELFAAEGVYRVQSILERAKEDRFGYIATGIFIFMIIIVLLTLFIE